MNGRFVINRTRAKVMGVCAGLADWMGVDVLIVRLGVIVATLVTGPLAVLLYILTGWLASAIAKSAIDANRPPTTARGLRASHASTLFFRL